jgi:hypothetical protein
VLPKLSEEEVVTINTTPRDGMLFTLPARDLFEQREERRITIRERCETAAEIVSGHDGASVVWCHLNEEGDLLERFIGAGTQVKGSMADEAKEERLLAFQSGELKHLITKPKIGCFGLNWQHCHNVVTFCSHSYEQYYQAVRRCWRFGQMHPVRVSVVTTEGEHAVLANLRRKAEQSDRMFTELVRHMNAAVAISGRLEFNHTERLPAWL